MKTIKLYKPFKGDIKHLIKPNNPNNYYDIIMKL